MPPDGQIFKYESTSYTRATWKARSWPTPRTSAGRRAPVISNLRVNWAILVTTRNGKSADRTNDYGDAASPNCHRFSDSPQAAVRLFSALARRPRTCFAEFRRSSDEIDAGSDRGIP